jgi:hypothetical protein
MALCREGDDVVLPSPYWVTYREQPVLARATVKALTCRSEHGFLVQPEQLRAVLTKSTRVVSDPDARPQSLLTIWVGSCCSATRPIPPVPCTPSLS